MPTLSCIPSLSPTSHRSSWSTVVWSSPHHHADFSLGSSCAFLLKYFRCFFFWSASLVEMSAGISGCRRLLEVGMRVLVRRLKSLWSQFTGCVSAVQQGYVWISFRLHGLEHEMLDNLDSIFHALCHWIGENLVSWSEVWSHNSWRILQTDWNCTEDHCPRPAVLEDHAWLGGLWAWGLFLEQSCY